MSATFPMEDHALIGDTHTAALVGYHGSIDWLCLARLDSGACFAVHPVATSVYRASEAPYKVLPNDVSVVGNTPGQYNLTLTTCAPRYFATHRMIIKATMVSVNPVA